MTTGCSQGRCTSMNQKRYDEMKRRNPWSRGTKLAHQVNVLERHARRLVQEEPHDDRAEEVARGEHEAVAELDGGDDEGREEREEEVLLSSIS